MLWPIRTATIHSPRLRVPVSFCSARPRGCKKSFLKIYHPTSRLLNNGFAIVWNRHQPSPRNWPMPTKTSYRPGIWALPTCQP